MRYWWNISLLFMTHLVHGQLTTNVSMSPPALVQNVLLGPGVQVSNVQYVGDFQAIGEFNYTGTNLGLSHGIVITTGTVFNTGDGPHGPNDEGASGVDNSGGSSAILNGILGSNSTFDAAELHLDFTAIGDTVSFNYIFGSEEYLEYVGQGFNDVFGLFISGPGISGLQNIAKLPNQTIVSIDNVNNVSNSAFYVDNGDGSEAPYNSNSQYIQYDGYTRVLTASSPVQCGETYHLIIAIADVGDGILDSGIFLEAQSLQSTQPVQVSFETSNDFYNNPSILAEGCTSVDFNLNRSNTTVPLDISVVVSGTATNGTDYSPSIPSTVTFNVGESAKTFSISTILDALNEDVETLSVTFLIEDACGNTVETQFNFQIRDVEPVSVTLADDTISCEDPNTLTLVPVVTGGLGPITYLWSTNETTPTINVTPVETTVYSVTVTDFCLNSSATADAEIFIPQSVPIILEPIDDATEACPLVPHTFTAEVSGGSGTQYNYNWQQNGVTIGTSPTLTVSPFETTDYTLIVSDQCGASDTTSFTFNIITILLVPAINTPGIICPGDSVLLTASATQGFGEYTYTWSHTEETSPNVWVSPGVTTTYRVDISDACQTYSVPIETTVSVHEPQANFTFSSNGEINSEVQFINTTPNGVSFNWDFGNGESSTLENPVTVYSDIGDYLVTLIVVDDIGCIDTVSKVVKVGSTIYIPNAFTPDGNRFNNVFEPVSYNMEILNMEIYNRWGELVFGSEEAGGFSWDGTYKGRFCQDGVYTYKIRFRKPNQDELEKTGHVTLLR